MTTEPPTPLELTRWHARQAAMLYHYASLDYLKKVRDMINQLRRGDASAMMVEAREQGEHAQVSNAKFGTLEPTANWALHGNLPFLTSLMSSLTQDITARTFGKYPPTGIGETLMNADRTWVEHVSAEELEYFESFSAIVGRMGDRIDKTVQRYGERPWDDFNFAYDFPGFAAGMPRIPRFRVLPEIVGTSGALPPRTGVYRSATDPNAALQFAAAGPDGVPLGKASTFNALGLETLAAVGRAGMWFDDDAMRAFVTTSRDPDLLRDGFSSNGPWRALAPDSLARTAFVERPDSWHFVEIVPEAFEDVQLDWNADELRRDEVRLAGPAVCHRTGFYLAPAVPDSRTWFRFGDTMPTLGSADRQRTWQWDPDQSRRSPWRFITDQFRRWDAP